MVLWVSVERDGEVPPEGPHLFQLTGPTAKSLLRAFGNYVMCMASPALLIIFDDFNQG
ncbi:hypothetical protein AGMMS49944_13380 [Spirochaetia bacterium]|nr:hypothetical protein AGMMS49944_13380 [Spirochaetia bacterium]